MLTPIELLRWIQGVIRRDRCCGLKQRYSRQSAIRAKEAMTKKTGRQFDVYWCPWCGKHHIGGSVHTHRQPA